MVLKVNADHCKRHTAKKLIKFLSKLFIISVSKLILT